MAQPFRLPARGRIDPSKPLSFSFNGKAIEGYAGDTVASALLANGIRLVGRSFKYHSPPRYNFSWLRRAERLAQHQPGRRAHRSQ